MTAALKKEIDSALALIQAKDTLTDYEKIIVGYVDLQYDLSTTFDGLIAGGLFHGSHSSVQRVGRS
jgi:hypothetical protein